MPVTIVANRVAVAVGPAVAVAVVAAAVISVSTLLPLSLLPCLSLRTILFVIHRDMSHRLCNTSFAVIFKEKVTTVRTRELNILWTIMLYGVMLKVIWGLLPTLGAVVTFIIHTQVGYTLS